MALAPIVDPYSDPIIAIAPNVGVGSYADITAEGGVTYAQILQSLGSYVYASNFFYVATEDFTQLQQAIGYNHFDANGNAMQRYLAFAVDPYQYQPTLYYETNPSEIVFNGLSSLGFQLAPNSRVYFKMFADVISNGEQLDTLHENNFKDVEKTEGVKFFDDYCNYLIDDEDINVK